MLDALLSFSRMARSVPLFLWGLPHLERKKSPLQPAESGRAGKCIRKTIIMVFAFLGAIPAFAHTTQFSTGQAATGQAQPVLRLMNDREFGIFLARLDSELVRSQQQLKKMDVKSLAS